MSNAFNLAICLPFGEFWAVPYELENESVETLLPPNTTRLERAIEQAQAGFNPETIIPGLWNADSCPVDLLPYLAWAMSVEEWDDEWSEDKKRLVIKESRFIHQHKGTLSAIKRALASIGQSDATIIERGDYVFRNGTAQRDGSHKRKGTGGWATYRVMLRNPATISQAMQIKRLLASVQRNCITLTAIDFKKAAIRRNGTAHRDGIYTRGVVSFSIS